LYGAVCIKYQRAIISYVKAMDQLEQKLQHTFASKGGVSDNDIMVSISRTCHCSEKTFNIHNVTFYATKSQKSLQQICIHSLSKRNETGPKLISNTTNKINSK
jgi:effector-binding domain-containing protein